MATRIDEMDGPTPTDMLLKKIELLEDDKRVLVSALEGLLEYTGGSDLVDPRHPIVRAHAAMGRK